MQMETRWRGECSECTAHLHLHPHREGGMVAHLQLLLEVDRKYLLNIELGGEVPCFHHEHTTGNLYTCVHASMSCTWKK